MLAQNFKTAKELGLAQVEVEALVIVLRILERGDIAREQLRGPVPARVQDASMHLRQLLP